MQETRLANGVRVLSETIPTVRSVALGVWVRHGSVHDPAEHQGVSHLLEHMVFKGTRHRTAREIVAALEGLGGSIDAYTSREHTGYQARVLDEHLHDALDVLADLVLAPLLRDEDLELERDVVLEEISTVDETPDDLVFELHGDLLWNGHPYGRSILGTRDTVSAIDGASLRAMHGRQYCGENLVVAAAGHVEHESFVREVERRFGGLPAQARVTDVAPARPAAGRMAHVRHDGVQTHIVLGSPTPGHSDRRRHALVLLSAAFGGGMSSRLFQRLREELALGYAVYSYQSFNRGAGVTGMYLGTRPGWEARALGAIRAEYADLAERGLEPTEFEQIKQQVKGQLLLSLESTSSRLYRLAGHALYDEPFRTVDDVLADIDAVDADTLSGVAAEFFAPARQTALLLGPEPPGSTAAMEEAWPELALH
ncbi:MAG: pitrilysin family protein [Gemmatimonadota bacterium]|nr:insulinase family protein [Gemmatimonadota bacterium]